MKPVRGEFRLPWRPKAWQWAGVGAALLLAPAMEYWLHVQQAEQQAARDLQASLLAEQAAAAASAAMAVPPYFASLQEFLKKRDATWSYALTVLEKADGTGITLSSVSVSPADRRVNIELQSTDHDALLRYISSLNEKSDETPGNWHWQLNSAQRAPTGVVSTITGVARHE
ncbi:MAG TPA: hypothetical protein VLA61_21340 [Ideonella sp.]|uniref:hypothetical protein n=1 Tax=Ideonella sp. TaxID=1929293 RepID=UPI002CE7EBDB|nr:hypothetical protein [Ideonella sp.]HSI50819.1 hypothetical protein [Ideonella sp.]